MSTSQLLDKTSVGPALVVNKVSVGAGGVRIAPGGELQVSGVATLVAGTLHIDVPGLSTGGIILTSYAKGGPLAAGDIPLTTSIDGPSGGGFTVWGQGTEEFLWFVAKF